MSFFEPENRSQHQRFQLGELSDNVARFSESKACTTDQLCHCPTTGWASCNVPRETVAACDPSGQVCWARCMAMPSLADDNRIRVT
jgi:hypothetical protein